MAGDRHRASVYGLIDLIASFFVLFATAVPAVLCLLYAADAFQTGGPKAPTLADVSDSVADTNAVLRAAVGTWGGFMLASGVVWWQQRRFHERLAVKVNELNDAFVAGDASLKQDMEALAKFVRPDADGALKFRQQLAPWTESLNTASSLDMSGMSLTGFTEDNQRRIGQILERGGQCRFLVVTPGSAASEVIAATFFDSLTQAQYDAKILATLRRLDTLGRTSLGSGRLEIRTMEVVPSNSITIIDRQIAGNDRAIIELYASSSASSADRPHLALEGSSSPVWYAYFCEEFDEHWRRAALYQSYGFEG